MTHRIHITKFILAIITVLFINVFANAQYRRQSNLYLSVGATAGTRNFEVSSNIRALENTNASLQGYSFSAAFGTNGIQGRVRQGFYNSASSERTTFKTAETEIGAAVFPLRLLRVRHNFFKPFISVAFNRNSYKLYGSYTVTKPQRTSMPPGTPQCPIVPGCTCICTMPPPVEPDLAPPGNDSNVLQRNFLGTVVVNRLNTGAGLMVHVPHQGRFVNVIAEVQYGALIGRRPLMLEFDRTHFSNQLCFNLGLEIGIRN